MMYSVWNQGAGKYDYYQTSEVQNVVNTPAPNHLKNLGGRSTLGLSVDQASWPLPMSAVKVGSGEFAKGRIASKTRGSGLAGIPIDMSSPMTWVGLAVIYFVGYQLWKSRGGKR